MLSGCFPWYSRNECKLNSEHFYATMTVPWWWRHVGSEVLFIICSSNCLLHNRSQVITWIQTIIHIPPQSLQRYMKYHVMLHRVVLTADSIRQRFSSIFWWFKCDQMPLRTSLYITWIYGLTVHLLLWLHIIFPGQVTCGPRSWTHSW